MDLWHFQSDETTRFALSMSIVQCARLAEQLLPAFEDNGERDAQHGFLPILRL